MAGAAAQLQRLLDAKIAKAIPQAAVRLRVDLAVAEPRRRTGQLAGSQKIVPFVGPGLAGVRVEYSSMHANWTNDGTRPHVIVPVRKKALYWPGARHPVRRVNHPGNRGTKWFNRAVTVARWHAVLQDAGFD